MLALVPNSSDEHQRFETTREGDRQNVSRNSSLTPNDTASPLSDITCFLLQSSISCAQLSTVNKPFKSYLYTVNEFVEDQTIENPAEDDLKSSWVS